MLKTHPICSAVCTLGILIFASACDKSEKTGSTTTTVANEGSKSPVASSASAAMPTAITNAGAAARKPALSWKGLSTPESVFHDETSDTYLVSNVDGQPLDVDGNGFISKLNPDGTIGSLRWIEGGKAKVTLNAPKGMTIANDRLYIADIDTVRMFDAKTGTPQGEIKIPGATFLNDVALAADGRVLVSDSGMKAGGKGFEPTGTDAVYAIEKDNKKVTTIAKAKDLGGPNGLVAGGADKTWVVTFGSGEIYSLDAKGKKSDVQKLPKGTLDGVLIVGNDVLVSSWESNSIYRGKLGGGADFKTVIEDVKSPADIGYDKKRSRVLVPLFMENEVRAYELSGDPKATSGVGDDKK